MSHHLSTAAGVSTGRVTQGQEGFQDGRTEQEGDGGEYDKYDGQYAEGKGNSYDGVDDHEGRGKGEQGNLHQAAANFEEDGGG